MLASQGNRYLRTLLIQGLVHFFFGQIVGANMAWPAGLAERSPTRKEFLSRFARRKLRMDKVTRRN
jgi:hypothetical protein